MVFYFFLLWCLNAKHYAKLLSNYLDSREECLAWLRVFKNQVMLKELWVWLVNWWRNVLRFEDGLFQVSGILVKFYTARQVRSSLEPLHNPPPWCANTPQTVPYDVTLYELPRVGLLNDKELAPLIPLSYYRYRKYLMHPDAWDNHPK